MLFLLFQAGEKRYVIEASRVVEVLPLLELSALSEMPCGVAGIFNYRGNAVPVVDLNLLLTGQPVGERFSTRIVLINYPDETGRLQRLGLIAERATEIIRRNEEEFTAPDLPFGAPLYLGPILMDRRGAIQWLRKQELLPTQVRDAVFCLTVESRP